MPAMPASLQGMAQGVMPVGPQGGPPAILQGLMQRRGMPGMGNLSSSSSSLPPSDLGAHISRASRADGQVGNGMRATAGGGGAMGGLGRTDNATSGGPRSMMSQPSQQQQQHMVQQQLSFQLQQQHLQQRRQFQQHLRQRQHTDGAHPAGQQAKQAGQQMREMGQMRQLGQLGMMGPTGIVGQGREGGGEGGGECEGSGDLWQGKPLSISSIASVLSPSTAAAAAAAATATFSAGPTTEIHRGQSKSSQGKAGAK